MAYQHVNLEGIEIAANKLERAKVLLDNDFNAFVEKSRGMDQHWQGKAAESAKSALFTLQKHNEERSKVLTNYVTLLKQQVSPGYQNAEATNTRLADKFK